MVLPLVQFIPELSLNLDPESGILGARGAKGHRSPERRLRYRHRHPDGPLRHQQNHPWKAGRGSALLHVRSGCGGGS